MGIDAAMLIRYRGEKPTEEQIARWSWDMARSVGAANFSLSDGLPTPEYNAKCESWFAAFKAHPLNADYDKANTHEDKMIVRKKIIADIGPHDFKELCRAIMLTPDYADEYEDAGKKVGDGKAWYQDGETLFAAEGEWFLKVGLWSRYYGVGYERGDLISICATAEWIEANIPNCEVWYGGDSSGVEAELFDAAAREKLKKHFYSEQGRDYYAGWARPGTFPTPKPCGLCIPGEPRFNQHGFGGGYVAVNCAGCGKSFSSRDGGVTWTEDKEK